MTFRVVQRQTLRNACLKCRKQVWGKTKQICSRLWRKEIVRLVLGMAWLGLVCMYSRVAVAVNKYFVQDCRGVTCHGV